jgi:hypothetical protein
LTFLDLAGLPTCALLVSLDSHSMIAHEHNRGLRGLGERIRNGVAAARRHGITAIWICFSHRGCS